MKDILKIIFMFCIVIVVFIFKDDISTFISDEIIYKGSNKVLTYNEYYLDNDYLYVQNIDSSSVTNYQEMLNMIYSIINSGDDSFSFYCDYDNCLNDINSLIDNSRIISNINNFVHPYNSFLTINIDVVTNGKITIKIKKVYNQEQINYINNYINNFITNNINESMTEYDKIKTFHDHIINNTIYDTTVNSFTADNLIKTGKSICGGYSDIISIYLNTLGIKNYKITYEGKNINGKEDGHVWNLVNLNDTWYHIDATWDDPIASDGKQYLLHNFFMISTEELFKLDNISHNYDTTIYLEAN